ncbi:spore coat protein [Bacillus sp. P14.5]|uniref:spore coat protein n=1 Tax=Bacillus sp. P14.5 TaxID=1983400 RepID=UPI000DEA09E3|nr:spore coat protein [Bacillus sp. P14.5]
MHVNHFGFNPNEQRRFIGRPGFGFGRPGFGFGRPGFGVGFGVPFLTGLAAGALLTPRPYYYPPYPYYPYPYYY